MRIDPEIAQCMNEYDWEIVGRKMDEIENWITARVIRRRRAEKAEAKKAAEGAQ